MSTIPHGQPVILATAWDKLPLPLKISRKIGDVKECVRSQTLGRCCLQLRLLAFGRCLWVTPAVEQFDSLSPIFVGTSWFSNDPSFGFPPTCDVPPKNLFNHRPDVDDRDEASPAQLRSRLWHHVSEALRPKRRSDGWRRSLWIMFRNAISKNWWCWRSRMRVSSNSFVLDGMPLSKRCKVTTSFWWDFQALEMAGKTTFFNWILRNPEGRRYIAKSQCPHTDQTANFPRYWQPALGWHQVSPSLL